MESIPAEKKTTGQKPIIDLRSVTKVYRVGSVDVHALRGIDLQIMPGEFCCIIGRSGSGKSTLLNMLAGLEPVTSGEVVINGKHLERMNQSELILFRQKYVGFIFQSFNLMPTLDARGNILLPMRLAGRRLSALRTLDQGNLSIAASPMMMSGLLASVIEAFARDHPHVRIDLHELTTDESVDYVRTGRCDFGLVSIAEHDPQLESKVVCAELLCLACTPSHPLAAKKRITWGEASDYPHITLRSVYSTRKTIDRILKAQGLELRSTIQAGTLATSLRLVKANLGVTLIPSYAREFAQDLGLKVMEIYDKKSYPHELSLLTRRGLKPSIAAAAFMDALQVHLQTRARRRQSP